MQKVIKMVAIPALLLICAFMIRQYLSFRSNYAVNNKVESIKNDSVIYFRDLFYTEHATRQVVEADLLSIKAHYSATMDSIKKRTGIKDKDIEAITAVSTATSGKITPVVDTLRSLDSTTGYRLSYHDDWIKLQGEIGKTPTISYLLKDSLIFTTYQKRIGLFRKATYLDGYSLNPAVHISGVTAIQISSEKSKRAGIGPYLGYGWNGSQWVPSAGISIHYSLIKF